MKPLDKYLLVALLALVALRVTGTGPAIVAPSGPVRAVIVHETGEMTPALSRLVTALRTGGAAEALQARSVPLDVLDDDSIDERGQAIVPPEWIQGVPLPALVIVDGTTRQVVRKGPLPATAAEVLKAIGVE